MKYGLRFRCEQPIVLPVNYNKILQAALLWWIDSSGEFSGFLHDVGYSVEKRKYKLFTFSNIKGNYIYNAQNKTLTFDDEIFIVLSFYNDDSHGCILENAAAGKPIRFGRSFVPLIGCFAAEEEYRPCAVDTVSPITVHSTLEKPDGKRLTHFYEPDDRDFSKLIRSNLIHKTEAVYGQKPGDDSFSIRPYNSRGTRRITTRYNGMIIKGWQGRFIIDGSPEMIKMALLSGIGDKNSIGFGCVLQNNRCQI